MKEIHIYEGNIGNEIKYSGTVSSNGERPPLPVYNRYLNYITDNYDDRIPTPIVGEFYYTFSNAGYIRFKLINVMNYIGTNTSLKIESGHYKLSGMSGFTLELYNDSDELVTNVPMAPPSPATSLGSTGSETIIFVPNAGKYYLKLKIGNLGQYLFYDMEINGNIVTSTTMYFVWQLYAEIVETIDDENDGGNVGGDDDKTENVILTKVPNTIFSGYVWDCYEHISDVDMNSTTNPLPLTSNDYLKIDKYRFPVNLNDRIYGGGDRYYLWANVDGSITKGVITRKRNPLEMTLSDIVGEYIIDDPDNNTLDYIGLENMNDADAVIHKHNWRHIVNDRSYGYDTMKIYWSNYPYSGYDVCTFVEELTGVNLGEIDTYSLNPALELPDEDLIVNTPVGIFNNNDVYCYEFSNSGHIDITITNNGNYVVGGSEIVTGDYTIEIKGTIVNGWRPFVIELYDSNDTLISTTNMAIVRPATASSGESKSFVSVDIPSAGKYYIKMNMSGSYKFWNMKGISGTLVGSCQLKSYWSIYVNAIEYMDENKCVSYYNYLNYWYEQSGHHSGFKPDTIDKDNLVSCLGCWDGLDSNQRVLWNDGNCMSDSSMFDLVFPISSLHYDMQIYKNDELGDNQLLRAKDIPNFELYDIRLDGSIQYPGVSGKGYTSLYFDDYVGVYHNNTDFITNSEEKVVQNKNYLYYNDLDVFNGIPTYIELCFRVIANNYGIITNSSYKPNVYVTFSNGNTHTFAVTSKSADANSTNSGHTSYSVSYNGQWRKSSTISNPNSSLYDGVYESYSNYNVSNGSGTYTGATMTITISGYKKFSLYIRSYAESSYDYVMVSQLDKTITYSTSYSNTTLVKAHTSGKQNSSTAISGYTLVEYDNMTGGTHTITIVYRKDGTVNNNDDRGYVLISKNNEAYYGDVQVTSYIDAYYYNSEKYSLKDIGVIKNIDYSGLYFENIANSLTPDPEVTYRLYYLNYWLGTGVNSRIYLSNYYTEMSIVGSTGDFISLDGYTTYTGNISFTQGGSGSSKYIEIRQTSLTNVLGKDCYFKTAFRSRSDTSKTIYMCFRVRVDSTGFITVNSSMGDCTIYMTNVTGQRIYVSGNSTGIVLYPQDGATTNGKLIGGYLYNTFAHGWLSSSAIFDSFTINYNSDSFATIDNECGLGQVMSLISPRCISMYNVFEYMTSSPSVDVYGYV